MNRCAHKGARVVSAPCRQHRQVLPLPVPRLGLQHRRQLRAIPLKSGYEGTRLAECEAAQGPGRRSQQRRAATAASSSSSSSDAGPDFDELLRRLAQLDRQHRRPLARGRARDHRRVPALPARLQLEDVRREPERHHASDGGARVVGGHGEARCGRTSRPTRPSRWRSSSSCPSSPTTSSSRTWACASSPTATATRACTSRIHSSTRRRRLRGGDAGGLRRRAQRARSWKVARHNTVYYPSLTIKGAIQSIRVVRPIAVDKTRDRELDLPPDGAPPERCCSAPTRTTASSTRRSRSSATTTCTPTAAIQEGPARQRQPVGQPAAQLRSGRGRPGRGHRDRHERDLDAQPVPRLGAAT